MRCVASGNRGNAVGVVVDAYGVAVYPRGVEVHVDGRHRVRGPLGVREFKPLFPTKSAPRGLIEGFTRSSKRRLAWLLANAPTDFALHVTLTYHARVDESDGAQVERRNRELVERAKTDLNRFLVAIRGEAGRYVWIQEFQKRGAIHFHLLIEHAVDERRLALAWCKATGQLHDPQALEHSVKANPVEDQTAARKYLIKYFGKGGQKVLPAGVQRAGRYWGASRTLRVDPLVQVLSAELKARRHDRIALQIVRIVRRYVTRKVGFKWRSGRLVFWTADMPGRLEAMVQQLRAHYREETYLLELLAKFDWEPADPAKEAYRLRLEGGNLAMLKWL